MSISMLMAGHSVSQQMLSVSSSSSASASSSAASSSSEPLQYAAGTIPTEEQLQLLIGQYRTLLHVTIPGRYQGSGRYHGTDTARKTVLITRTLPQLQFGKVPSAEDHRALTMARFSELSNADQKFMLAWKNKNCPDPRRKDSQDKSTQQSILQYAVATGTMFGTTTGAKVGRRPSYKFDWGPYKGNTVHAVMKAGSAGQWSCGAAFLAWVGSSKKFVWAFPKHLSLFTELRQVMLDGWSKADPSGSYHTICLPTEALEKYEAYVDCDRWTHDAVLLAANGVDGEGNPPVGVTLTADITRVIERVKSRVAAAVRKLHRHRHASAALRCDRHPRECQ